MIVLWSTGTHLFQALHLLNLWEYRYINVLCVWRKIKHDGTTNGKTLGTWSRVSCEFLLIGSLGKVGQFKSGVHNVN